MDGRDKTEYESWRALHDPVTVRGDLVLARDALTQRGYGTSLGLLGFCFGGGRLMEEVALNTRGLNPNAVAVFYPTSKLVTGVTAWACPYRLKRTVN